MLIYCIQIKRLIVLLYLNSFDKNTINSKITNYFVQKENIYYI